MPASATSACRIVSAARPRLASCPRRILIPRVPTSFRPTPPERLALRWIQKYISAFGGDPTKVTMCVYL